MPGILTLETQRYAIKLDNFEGPLDLLCSLIEKNKMNIYEIKLDEKQEKLLRKLLTQGDEFMLASKEDIENEGVKLSDGNNKEIISNHSWKILSSSAEKTSFNFDEKYTVDLTNRK